MWQALQCDNQVPDGVHPGITSLLILGHQVQHLHAGVRAEDQGEGSVGGDVVKPTMLKDDTTLFICTLTSPYPRYPLSCWRCLSDIHLSLHRYPSDCNCQNLQGDVNYKMYISGRFIMQTSNIITPRLLYAALTFFADRCHLELLKLLDSIGGSS